MFMRSDAAVSPRRPLLGWVRFCSLALALAAGAGVWGVPALVAQDPVRLPPANPRKTPAENPVGTPAETLPETQRGSNPIADPIADPYAGALPAESPQVDPAVADEVRRLTRMLREAARRLDPETGGGGAVGRLVQEDPVRTITVREGDSLVKLAQRHLGSASEWPRLLVLNPEVDPQKLRVGQALVVPAGSGAMQGPISEFVRIAPPGGLAGGAMSARPPRDRNSALSQPAAGGAAGGAIDPLDARPGAARPQHASRPTANLAISGMGVLDLLTRLAESEGEVALAKLRLESAAAHIEQLVRPEREVLLALRESEVRLRTAERKVDLVRRTVKAELARAEGEVQACKDRLAYSELLHKRQLITADERAADQRALEQSLVLVELLRGSLAGR